MLFIACPFFFLLCLASPNVPEGSYLLEVQSPQYTYPSVRVPPTRGQEDSGSKDIIREIQQITHTGWIHILNYT